jgi:aspartate/methionine/tyrosine aminotransferase
VLEHLLLHWNDLENLHREYLQSHHDLFMDVCNGLGLDLMRKPEAGLFATLKLPADLGLDSTSVALELAEQHGIGVVPSTDFQEEGPAFLRLNFSVPREQIEPGLVRLKSALECMA